MPCSVDDIKINPPDSPSGPSIGGFGIPFALNLPNINPFLPGFPEDLLNIFNTLQLLIPPGALKPQLSLNFGKDLFDSILKLLDQFLPFLMLYKFFLPILNIIICIIEVICSIPNPFKMIPAIIKLFSECIPAFLALFPIFALIIMIISLLLLLIALIKYIIEQILKLVEAILRNIAMLTASFQESNANGVLAIAKKLGALLCIFQNLFVLLAIFQIIIQIIKDILGMAFAIPPCDDDNPEGCCTSNVCPTIAKNPYTRTTGSLQYLGGIGSQTDIVLPQPPPLPSINLSVAIRDESWQIYDNSQNVEQAFSNIFNAFDVPISLDEPPPFFKPIFFPTDATYNEKTSSKQAPYTVDLRLFYNPAVFGRTGEISRHIRFKNCIVIAVPSLTLTTAEGVDIPVLNGVISVTGGLGYEDDGKTRLLGFEEDGITQTNRQATLNTFIHKPSQDSTNPTYSEASAAEFTDIEYTFRPNPSILMSKNLITLGCIPDISLVKGFVNTAIAGDVVLKTQLFRDLINSPNFPNPDATQQCLSTALAALRTNLTTEGVAEFQTTAILCLEKLQNDTLTALSAMIGLGFDPCKSVFSAIPTVQFTSKPIVVKVDINENNGLSLTNGLPAEVGTDLASRIKGHISFGEISDFSFDGYQSFTANITSNDPGSGQLMISFDNNTFCTNITNPPSHTLQAIDYRFVYTSTILTSEGDASEGTAPRRDAGDLADMGESKDGS